MQGVLVAVFSALLFYIFGHDVTKEKAEDQYDFIVVGAGTTGSVVASKLSDHSSSRVLLLEAGMSDLKEPTIFIPGYSHLLPATAVDWNDTIAPQRHAFFRNPSRVAPYSQGKVLGGSSSINYMVYIRGSPHDYDSWVDHGAKGWGYKSIERNFRNVEKASGEYMPDSMGKDGRVKLSHKHFPGSQMSKLMSKIANDFGFSISNYQDRIEGFSYCIMTLYGMLRQNSVISYLRSVLPDSKRQLDIIEGARVTRILFDEYNKAIGVTYVKRNLNLTVYVRKEVILSAGSIASPQLLMVSGVGPREHLEKFNIPVLIDSPGVGSNLNDHIYVFSTFQTNITLQQKEAQSPEEQYLTKGTGPLVDIEYYFHSTKSKYFNTSKSASNLKRPFPDIFTFFLPGSSDDGKMTVSTMVTIAHGKSRGTISLRSADPLIRPIIDPQYYSHADDVDVQLDGLRLMERYETSEAMIAAGARYIAPQACDSLYTPAPRTDEYYRCVIKYAASNMFHACGTAKMGSPTDKSAVVDSQLRVYGVKNLRVADASVMPHVTSGNIQAPCYMIGDKAAEMIIEEWGLIRDGNNI